MNATAVGQRTEIMTVGEVARFLKISPTTVYRLVERREMPAHRLTGKTIRFHRSEVEQWMRRR